MKDSNVWQWTAADIAREVRAKTLSAHAVTAAILERLDRLNPMLHAFCTPAPDPETGEEAPTPDPVEHTLTELQRMMATINKINSETACAPDGMYVTDAAGNYVAKPGFFVRYPDQLSSYVAPTGNLGKAAPGTWCVYFYLFIIFPIYLLLVWASRLTWVCFFA